MGQKAIESLKALGLNANFHQLDVESSESINKFGDYLKKTYGGIDVLINNAGVYYHVKNKTIKQYFMNKNLYRIIIQI